MASFGSLMKLPLLDKGDIYQKLLVSALHGRYFGGVKRNENKENE